MGRNVDAFASSQISQVETRIQVLRFRKNPDLRALHKVVDVDLQLGKTSIPASLSLSVSNIPVGCHFALLAFHILKKTKMDACIDPL